MTRALRLLAAAAFSSATVAVAAVATASAAPQQLYGGDEIIFQVLRNGAPAGEHRVAFSGDADALTVTARTRATASFFGLFDMPFVYDSEALWQDGVLQTLQATHQRFGGVRRVAVARAADGRYRTDSGASAAAPLLPTNHWNAAAVAQTTLFNTLNGKLARVTVISGGMESVTVGERQQTARRYQYRGDLDTEVWYDDEGRWLKLRFAAWGATYEFICRRCAP